MKAKFLSAGKGQTLEIENVRVEVLTRRKPESPFSYFDPEPKYHFALCWVVPGYGRTDLKGENNSRVYIYLTDAEFRRLAAKINQTVTARLEEERQ